MTPAEFKEAQRKLGLSDAKLARVLNCDSRTVRRWKSGERHPNPVAARVMTWLIDGFEPPELVVERKRTPRTGR